MENKDQERALDLVKLTVILFLTFESISLEEQKPQKKMLRNRFRLPPKNKKRSFVISLIYIFLKSWKGKPLFTHWI